MSLKGIGQQTLDVIERGQYLAPSGRRVELGDSVERAVQGTVLYRPGEFSRIAVDPLSEASPSGVRIEVTAEKTGAAARRLVEAGASHVGALNFASAKNPGGGFLGGAKAQEEDLARCSALYPCLLTQRDYYDANRADPSPLYTDHLIYAPDVPFFRDESLAFLEQPFQVSLLTAPAPNAGVALSRDPGVKGRLRAVLQARAQNVLRVASHQGHRTLVLGAWGCGVFRNDPVEVAEAFALALAAFQGAFTHVVFAVYERGGDGPNLRAFQARFG